MDLSTQFGYFLGIGTRKCFIFLEQLKSIFWNQTIKLHVIIIECTFRLWDANNAIDKWDILFGFDAKGLKVVLYRLWGLYCISGGIVERFLIDYGFSDNVSRSPRENAWVTGQEATRVYIRLPFHLFLFKDWQVLLDQFSLLLWRKSIKEVNFVFDIVLIVANLKIEIHDSLKLVDRAVIKKLFKLIWIPYRLSKQFGLLALYLHFCQ